jgi:hypothetical protein
MNAPQYLPSPGWPPHAPAATRRGRAWDRVRHQLLIGLGLFTAAFLLGLSRSPRGWLLIGLAWVVLDRLGAHRAQGRTVPAVLEYAVVAALTVALVGAAPTAPKVNVAVDQRPPAKAKVEAAQGGLGLDGLRQSVSDLYEQLAKGFPPDPEPAPKGGR